MNRKHALVGLILSAAPLLVLAQNTNTPGGQASTGSPLEQTKTSSQKPAFDKSTKTTNPDSMANTTSGTMANGSTGTMAKKPRNKTTSTTPAGDVPTYPAPAPDGTPTK